MLRSGSATSNNQQATTMNEATEASGARGANVAIVPLLPPPAFVTTTPTSTEGGGGHPRRAVIAGAARPRAGGAVARGCCQWRPYPRGNYDLGGGAGARREATTTNEAIEEGNGMAGAMIMGTCREIAIVPPTRITTMAGGGGSRASWCTPPWDAAGEGAQATTTGGTRGRGDDNNGGRIATGCGCNNGNVVS